MKYTIVHYKIKPHAIEENRRLIRAVFQDLHRLERHGLRYASLSNDEGSFFHIARATADAGAILSTLPAFTEFQKGIAERADVLPEFSDVEVVGNLELFK